MNSSPNWIAAPHAVGAATTAASAASRGSNCRGRARANELFDRNWPRRKCGVRRACVQRTRNEGRVRALEAMRARAQPGASARVNRTSQWRMPASQGRIVAELQQGHQGLWRAGGDPRFFRHYPARRPYRYRRRQRCQQVHPGGCCWVNCSPTAAREFGSKLEVAYSTSCGQAGPGKT